MTSVQLRENINYDLAHDWKAMFRGKSFEELLSESAEDLPRLRIERDSRRHKKKLQGPSAASAVSMTKLRVTFARATLLDEFGRANAR